MVNSLLGLLHDCPVRIIGIVLPMDETKFAARFKFTSASDTEAAVPWLKTVFCKWANRHVQKLVVTVDTGECVVEIK